MIQLVLSDLDKYCKGKIFATEMFKDVSFLKVKPAHYDIHYLPRAKRFEIGFDRFKGDQAQKLFVLTHELCHILQRDNLKENMKYSNLGLQWIYGKDAIELEKQVVSLQYSLYTQMNWNTKTFNELPFGIAPGITGNAIQLVDKSLNFNHFEQKFNDMENCLIKY